LAPAQIGERTDVSLDEELVHAAVAAGDDKDVLLRRYDHGDGVVHRGMHDVKLAGREPFALLRRVLGKGELQGEVASRENPLRHTGMQRQRLRVGEAVDANRSRNRGGGRGCDHRQDENPSLDHSPFSGSTGTRFSHGGVDLLEYAGYAFVYRGERRTIPPV